MKLIVSGVHLELSDALKEAVESQLWSTLDHMLPGDNSSLEVHLVDTNGPKGGQDQECRVTVHIPKRSTIHITEASDNIYKSINLCADRVERAFKKQMELIRDEVHATP